MACCVKSIPVFTADGVVSLEMNTKLWQEKTFEPLDRTRLFRMFDLDNDGRFDQERGVLSGRFDHNGNSQSCPSS